MTTKIEYAVKIKRPNGYWTTHAVVANSWAAKRLFNHFVKRKIQTQVVEIFG